MEFLDRYTVVLVTVLLVCSNVYCNSAERDRRFIIFGDSNIGFALSVGGSIGSGIISNSKFKGKSFTVKNGHIKKRRFRHEYDDYYGPMWLPWWSPQPYY